MFKSKHARHNKQANKSVTPIKPAPRPQASDVPHPLLLEILRTKRSHNSIGDYLFRSWLIKRLAPWAPRIEGEGNIVVTNGTKSRVAFSCHIDTCHTDAESDGTPQIVTDEMGLLTLGSKSQCLGADDGVGIFLMLQMLDAGVPGTYMFHTGEECGGIGSSSLADSRDPILSTFDLIVAFDRAVQPGTHPEVITQQGSTVCASDTLGQALADALNAAVPSLGYVVSHKGSFTDTRNYAPHVAECINLGCFYCDQHGPGEFVDTAGVNALMQACLSVQWGTLPIDRDLVNSRSLAYSRRPGNTLPAWTSAWDTTTHPAPSMYPAGSIWDDEEPDYTDANWGILADALTHAEQTGSQLTLKDVVAEIVAPEHTDGARKMMTLRISDSDIEAAMTEMYEGAEPADVAQYLFDTCSPI